MVQIQRIPPIYAQQNIRFLLVYVKNNNNIII